ncbi:MAG TPA: hypothetical protein VK541_04985, partial [Pedobacter sp.]|uniref:glycosyl hydrolase family 95 catalytic domain-containing protein n=1 Tax=Pedobacter sp. TaxID=1411316 RepID=UPI002C69A6E1
MKNNTFDPGLETILFQYGRYPLIHFMQALEVPGRPTARQMYGARGWTVHHLTDTFGHTAVHDGVTNGMSLDHT